MPAVGTAGTYGTVNNFPVITTDAKGRVSNVTENNVTSAVLMGLITTDDSSVLPTDTILQAIGKVEAVGARWIELNNTAALTNNSNVTLTSIAQLQFPVVAGRYYRIECQIRFRSASTNTGLTFTFNCPTSGDGTIAGSVSIPTAVDGTAGFYQGAITALGDIVTSPNTPANNTDYLATIYASFICTVSGTLTPQFRSENSGTIVTVQAGSSLITREFV
jgi:hypothetical protein